MSLDQRYKGQFLFTKLTIQKITPHMVQIDPFKAHFDHFPVDFA